jgi:hypothetical protein
MNVKMKRSKKRIELESNVPLNQLELMGVTSVLKT